MVTRTGFAVISQRAAAIPAASAMEKLETQLTRAEGELVVGHASLALQLAVDVAIRLAGTPASFSSPRAPPCSR